MNKSYLGFLLLILALVLPAMGQVGGEEGAYQSFRDEQNAFQKISKGESFVSSYKNSGRRPQIDLELITIYTQNMDWAKIMSRTEAVHQEVPTAPANLRAQVYEAGMDAAIRLNNMQKMTEYGELALTANPNSLIVLIAFSSSLPANLPTEPAARKAALAKPLSYAQKIQTVPKPPTMTDAAWTGVQARAHSSLGKIHYALNEFVEAATEHEIALKSNPRDVDGQFQLGMSNVYLMSMGAAEIQTTQAKLVEASKGTDEVLIKSLLEKRQGLEKDVIEKRDVAIESLGKAVALGAAAGHQMLDPLYKSQNPTSAPADIEAFVAKKKAELDALAPPARGAAPARGGAPGGRN